MYLMVLALGFLRLLTVRVAFLLLAYVIPFLGVVRWSVTLPEPGFSQYHKLATDPLALSVLIRTMRICLLVTVVATAAAYAIAYVLARETRSAQPDEALMTGLMHNIGNLYITVNTPRGAGRSAEPTVAG